MCKDGAAFVHAEVVSLGYQWRACGLAQVVRGWRLRHCLWWLPVLTGHKKLGGAKGQAEIAMFDGFVVVRYDKTRSDNCSQPMQQAATEKIDVVRVSNVWTTLFCVVEDGISMLEQRVEASLWRDIKTGLGSWTRPRSQSLCCGGDTLVVKDISVS